MFLHSVSLLRAAGHYHGPANNASNARDAINAINAIKTRNVISDIHAINAINRFSTWLSRIFKKNHAPSDFILLSIHLQCRNNVGEHLVIFENIVRENSFRNDP